jgi:hypothetical protein
MGWVETDTEGNVTVHAPAATTRGPIPPKAYLDNCLVGGLVQDDLDPAESKGIYNLIDRAKDGLIELVSSTVTKEEIDRPTFVAVMGFRRGVWSVIVRRRVIGGLGTVRLRTRAGVRRRPGSGGRNSCVSARYASSM